MLHAKYTAALNEHKNAAGIKYTVDMLNEMCCQISSAIGLLSPISIAR